MSVVKMPDAAHPSPPYPSPERRGEIPGGNAGTYFITRHVCDGGKVGCSSRRRVRSNMSILRGLPTKRCAPEQALAACASSTCPRALSNGIGPLLSAPSLRVAARTVGCCVALLDHIDIWPSSGALHP